MRIVRPLALGCALALVFPAYAAENVVACVSDIPLPPLTFPDRDGQAQHLMRLAASATGIALSFVVEPRNRCLYNVKQGNYALLAIGADAPSLRAEFAYPMLGDNADARRALGASSASFVVRNGSSVKWDGQNLSGVTRPVLVRTGQAALLDWLSSRNFPYEEVRSQPQIASMLKADRSDIAAMREDDIREYLEIDGKHGELTVLSPAIRRIGIYAVANKAFAEKNRTQLERFWNEIGRIRETSEWQKLAPSFYSAAPAPTK